VFTGVYSVVGILAAMAEREKTGRGGYIDTALLDTQVSVLANQALFYLVSGETPRRMGNAHATVVPYQVFPVSDGHIIIACGNDGQFARLMRLLGASEMASDPKYQTNEARVSNRATLIACMVALTVKFTRADLLRKLEEIGVPGGPINSVADVFDDPQVIAREMRLDLSSATAKGGSIPGVRTPITLNSRRAADTRPSPRLGEHTEEILRELGEN